MNTEIGFSLLSCLFSLTAFIESLEQFIVIFWGLTPKTYCFRTSFLKFVEPEIRWNLRGLCKLKP